MTIAQTSTQPREFDPGAEFLAQQIRDRVHPSINTRMIRAVLAPALSELAVMAQRIHEDQALLPATTAPAPESAALAEPSWSTFSDWLIQIRGIKAVVPERETTGEQFDEDSMLFQGE